jgi:hypothetical protein
MGVQYFPIKAFLSILERVRTPLCKYDCKYEDVKSTFTIKNFKSQAWWHMSAIPALKG